MLQTKAPIALSGPFVAFELWSLVIVWILVLVDWGFAGLAMAIIRSA